MHLPEALKVVFPVSRRRRNKIRGREFTPCEETLLITLGIQVIAMRIVSRSHAIRTHLLYHRYSLALVLARNSPTFTLLVLMVVHTAYLTFFTIEIKVSIFAKLRRAKTEVLFNRINPCPFANRCAQSIEIGSLGRPQFRCGNNKFIACRLNVRSNNLMSHLRIIGTGNKRFYFYAASFCVGNNRHSRPSVYGRIDTDGIGLNKLDLTVESPEYRIVGSVRQIVEIIIVVYGNIELIRAIGSQVLGELKTKTCDRALMPPHDLAIDCHCCVYRSPSTLNKKPTVRRNIRKWPRISYTPSVDARRTDRIMMMAILKSVGTVSSIFGIPCMRNCNRNAVCRPTIGKHPFNTSCTRRHG